MRNPISHKVQETKAIMENKPT